MSHNVSMIVTLPLPFLCVCGAQEMTNMDGVSAKEMAGSEGRNMQSYARRFRRRARRIASKVGQKSKR